MSKAKKELNEICLKNLLRVTQKSLIAIGENIKSLRVQHSLTQNDLAFYCYLDISVISKLERGVATNITLNSLQKIALLFDVPLEYLISSKE